MLLQVRRDVCHGLQKEEEEKPEPRVLGPRQQHGHDDPGDDREVHGGDPGVRLREDRLGGLLLARPVPEERDEVVCEEDRAAQRDPGGPATPLAPVNANATRKTR